MRYVFDVEFVYDHDALKRGLIAQGERRVSVEADNETEAERLATQIVGCDVMATSAVLLYCASGTWDSNPEPRPSEGRVLPSSPVPGE